MNARADSSDPLRRRDEARLESEWPSLRASVAAPRTSVQRAADELRASYRREPQQRHRTPPLAPVNRPRAEV